MVQQASRELYYVSYAPTGEKPKFLFETDQGQQWLTLESAGSMNPKPIVMRLTKDDAQGIANKHNVPINITPTNGQKFVINTPDQPEQPSPPKAKRPSIKLGQRARNGAVGAVNGAKAARFLPGVGTGVGAAIGGLMGAFKNPVKEEDGQEKRGKRKFSPLVFLICFALGITLALIVAWNVQPFIKFVEILASKLDFFKFAQLLMNLWIIGAFFTAIASFAFAVIGIVLYVICQVIEIAPMLYRRNPERMRRTIESWQQWAKYPIHRSDPEHVRKLKTDYNDSPLSSYRWMCTACQITYLFELVVCFVAEPPCTPAWKFPWYLMTFQFGKIDWINVCLAISVLFAAQWVVAGILKLWPEVFPKAPEKQQA